MRENSILELRNVAIYHRDNNSGGLLPWGRKSAGELVLSDVNLSVGEGEIVYLIGRVGSGKSSLLKTLYGELPLRHGDGNIVGFDLRKLKTRQIPYLRRQIGVVFQDYQLLTDRNVFSNLHYVMKATGWKSEVSIRRRIEEVLDLVRLVNKEYKMPYELSGGEQQRLAIARALVNGPKVILADEPTGNLDPAASGDIMTLFNSIAKSGCSILLSTHNISNLEQYPSRTLRFTSGRVEELDIDTLLGVRG